jgi:hypothetical protein
MFAPPSPLNKQYIEDSPHQGSTLHNGEQAQDLCLLLPLH